MGSRHEHIQAFLMFEIEKRLEEVQRRGVGYIESTSLGGIDYTIDGVTYHIIITEKIGRGKRDG